MSSAKFDGYAERYDEVHNRSLAASGETCEYFADYKLACLQRIGAPTSEPLLDYGCGVGNVLAKFAESFVEVHGYDPSQESLRIASERVPSAVLHRASDRIPSGHFATAVLSGVLHHVPRPERIALLRGVKKCLRTRGRVVIFEHNPLNPVTRRAVADCPFDDDADLLWPWQAKRLLVDAGYSAVRLDFIVFFPRPLAWLRPLEPRLRALPAGAQTMLVGTC